MPGDPPIPPAAAGPTVPLGDSDPRLLSIIDSAMDGIITIDESQRVVLFNRAAERIFGVPAAEALGSPVERFIPERFRPGHSSRVRAFADTGVSVRTMGHLGTLYGLRADGAEFPLEASISQTESGGVRLFTVILRDVTERRRLEEQFLQAQKMEGIGRLAGGIAHDFNTLLMAIFNYLTLAANRLEAGHPARQPLTQAHEAANRAATLTRQLLLFARKQAANPRVVSPREVVAGMVPMLRRLIGDDIDLRTRLDPATGNVRADPVQLEQVLMNLVVNARDAMPSGGTLTIETGNLTVDRADDGGLSGPHVALTIADTGLGMTPETLARLFEPFFTTKGPGKGTGLGLATCHGIVRQERGQILVQSAPGQGTTVRVLLPREPDAADPGRTPAPDPLRARGGETVLVADPSALVRDLAAEALRSRGYTVLTAADAGGALQLAEAHIGPIHLLVADAGLAGAGGGSLGEVLARGRGPVPALYLSGAAEAEPGAAPAGSPPLPKPFTTDALLLRVRQALDQRRGR